MIHVGVRGRTSDEPSNLKYGMTIMTDSEFAIQRVKGQILPWMVVLTCAAVGVYNVFELGTRTPNRGGNWQVLL